MTTPPIHYGDKVVTIRQQFAVIERKLTRLQKTQSILTIVIMFHLGGLDFAPIVSTLFKALGKV